MLPERQRREKIRTLARQLENTDWFVRSEAVKELGKIGKPTLPLLARTLKDKTNSVRVSTVEALGTIEHEAVLPHLAQALQDKNEVVRIVTVETLEKIARRLQGKNVESKEARALQFVVPYFRENEHWQVFQKAFQAALKGKITEKNARLYLKQLRAMKGNLK